MFMDNVGINPGKYEKEHGSDKFWEVVDNIEHFWLNMEWTKDGKELWDYVKDKNPTILTTPAKSVKTCIEDKKNWVKREIGDVKIIFEKDKFKHASTNYILIDDFKNKIKKWNEEGGIGILHRNTKDTINKLKELGI